jgi:Carbonic anhydrase
LRLQPLVKKLRDVTLEGQSVHLDYTFTMASLLPRDREIYYTYQGSLTTPPCSEVVTWIVFPEPQFISYNQVSELRGPLTQKLPNIICCIARNVCFYNSSYFPMYNL